MDIDAQKRALRRELGRRRRALEPDRVEAAGRAIAQWIATSAEFEAAHTLALFASLPDEPAMQPLFELACGVGKRVLLPRIDTAGSLDFCPVASWVDLLPGRYGVLEPSAGVPPLPIGAIDLVLVPGVAFDRAGRRVGRGKGYYDRTFLGAGGGAAGEPFLIGVAFAFQLVETVPAGPLDRAMDAVVTEEGLIRAVAPAGGARRTGRA